MTLVELIGFAVAVAGTNVHAVFYHEPSQSWSGRRFEM